MKFVKYFLIFFLGCLFGFLCGCGIVIFYGREIISESLAEISKMNPEEVNKILTDCQKIKAKDKIKQLVQ